MRKWELDTGKQEHLLLHFSVGGKQYQNEIDLRNSAELDRTAEHSALDDGVRISWTFRRQRELRLPPKLSEQLQQIPRKVFRRLESQGYLETTLSNGKKIDLDRGDDAAWTDFSTPVEARPVEGEKAVFEVLYESPNPWPKATGRRYSIFVHSPNGAYVINGSADESIYSRTLDLAEKTTESRRGAVVLATYVSTAELTSDEMVCKGLDIVDGELKQREPTTSPEPLLVELPEAHANLADASAVVFKLVGPGLTDGIPLAVRRDAQGTAFMIPGGSYDARERIITGNQLRIKAFLRNSGAEIDFVDVVAGEDRDSLQIRVESPAIEVVLIEGNGRKQVSLNDVQLGVGRDRKQLVCAANAQQELMECIWSEEAVTVALRDRERKRLVPVYRDGVIRLEVVNPTNTMNRFEVVLPDGGLKPAAGWRLTAEQFREIELTPAGGVESRYLRDAMTKRAPRIEPPEDLYYLRSIPLDGTVLSSSSPMQLRAEYQVIRLEPSALRGFCPGLSIVRVNRDQTTDHFHLFTSESDTPYAESDGGAIYALEAGAWSRLDQPALEIEADARVFIEPLGVRSQGTVEVTERNLRALQSATNQEQPDRDRVRQLEALFPDRAGIDIVLAEQETVDSGEYELLYKVRGKETIKPLLRSPWSRRFVGAPLPVLHAGAGLRLTVLREGKPIATRESGTSVFIAEDAEKSTPADSDLQLHVVLVNGTRTMRDFQELWAFLRVSLARALGKLSVDVPPANATVVVYAWTKKGLSKMCSTHLDLGADGKTVMRTAYASWQAIEPDAQMLGHGAVETDVDWLSNQLRGTTVNTDDRVIVFDESSGRAPSQMTFVKLAGRQGSLERVFVVGGIDGYLRRAQAESYYHEQVRSALVEAIVP